MNRIFGRFLPVIAGMVFVSTISEASSGIRPEEAPDFAPQLQEAILPPAGVVSGHLENGLGYVLARNDSPSRMIECRLIFKAGSALETDENRGAAHFLEHMAFGGTRHFPKRGLVEYLESLGAQYGIGINAFTGYDRTIYMFSIPSDDISNLDNALLILKDWLVDITIDPKKVEREKGVIIEELRGYDVGDEFYDLKIGTNEYSKGIPLGRAEDIVSMTARKLKEFHSKWYTLGQATVVLVGDIDVEDAESRIEKTFGGLRPTSSQEYMDFPLEYAAGTSLQEVRDTLLRRIELEIIVPHKATMKSRVQDAVNAERNRMLVSALSSRFRDTRNMVSLSNSWYLADKEHFVISVSGECKEVVSEEMRRGISELYRVAEEGFQPGEMDIVLDKAKARVRRGCYDKNSYTICDEVTDAVLFGDADVTDIRQLDILCDAVSATTSEDLQVILKEWLVAAENTRLVACKFNPESTSGFTAQEIDCLWERGKCTRCEPYTFVPSEDEYACEATPVPSFLLRERDFNEDLIARRNDYGNIGVTDVTLTNGFRLVLRPTEDDERKIQMQMFAPGGLSRLPEDDYPLYEGMAGYMELGGIEKLEDDVYFSLLHENEVGILLAMEPYWHGIIASAPSSNMRLMLNLIEERMLRPGLNYEEFEYIRESELESFGEESYLSRLMKNDMQRQLNMQIDSLMGNLMYGRRTEMTEEDLHALNLDRIAEKYKELYSNPTGMTCVICGDFNVDELLKEAVPVFGHFSPGLEPNRMGLSHFSLPETTKHIEYPNANETQTMFDYIRFGKYEPSMRSGLKLKLMNNLIRNRLLTVLREQESLVYSPYASLFYTANPDGIFYIDINASVDRKNTGKVHGILDDIIKDLQKNKVSEKELNTLKRIFIVNKRTHLEEDATANWKTYLVGQIKNDETLLELDLYEDVLYSITPAELRAEFRRCFDTDRYMILSLGDF